jgi:hypothetical protein
VNIHEYKTIIHNLQEKERINVKEIRVFAYGEGQVGSMRRNK